MNTNYDDMPLDDSRFDRLVDGELTEQQRRELLSQLDNETGGWRRCALAFLESQCWKQTLGAMRKEPKQDASQSARPAPAPRSSQSRTPWSHHVGTLMAMAACFLVAFWVGSVLHHGRLETAATPDGAASQVATIKTAKPVKDAALRTQRAVAAAPTQRPSSPDPWRVVTVASPSGSAHGEPLRVPAVERDAIDQQWAKSVPPAMPDDVMQAFHRSGHEIEQHRELVPVPLRDGRQLVLPVDHVNVHYVGNDDTY